MKKETNPAGRIDVLLERCLDLYLKRFVDPHPLTQRLKAVGVDGPSVAREELSRWLKRERVTDVKSVAKALRK